MSTSSVSVKSLWKMEVQLLQRLQTHHRWFIYADAVFWKMSVSFQHETLWTQTRVLWERVNICALFLVNHAALPAGSWSLSPHSFPSTFPHFFSSMLRFRRVPKCLLSHLRSSAAAVNSHARVTVVHACRLFRCLVLAPPLMDPWKALMRRGTVGRRQRARDRFCHSSCWSWRSLGEEEAKV